MCDHCGNVKQIIYLFEILNCDQSEFEVEASEKESIQGLKAEGSHSKFVQLRA